MELLNKSNSMVVDAEHKEVSPVDENVDTSAEQDAKLDVKLGAKLGVKPLIGERHIQNSEQIA